MRGRVGVVEVSVSLLSVIVDCRDPRRQAEWWAQVLAYQVNERNPDEFQVSDTAGAAVPALDLKYGSTRQSSAVST